MADRELDIEFFIEEIKKYPEIWNTSDENYHNKTKKRAAWTTICCLFSDNFEQKDVKEKNEICNKLIKTWRNIKDSYYKSLKKKNETGQVADLPKKYIYARQLSFLGSSGATTETQSSLEGTQEDEDVAQPEKTVESEGSEGPKYDQGSSLKRKRNVESALIDFMMKPTPTPPPASEPDPDRSFSESVLPSIRKFDEDQKIEFRYEVLKLIKRMRNTQTIHPPNFPSHTYPMAHSNRYLPPSSFHSSKHLQSSEAYQFPPQYASTNFPYNHASQPSSHSEQTPLFIRVSPPTPFSQMTELRTVASSSSADFFSTNIASPTLSTSTSHDQDESMDLFS